MHGDLTPWNLRRRSDGTITLVDWEDADWGPLAADAVMLHASRHALFGVTPPPMPVEAVAFWRQRICQRPRDFVDERIRADLLAALDRMATEVGPSGLARSPQV